MRRLTLLLLGLFALNCDCEDNVITYSARKS